MIEQQAAPGAGEADTLTPSDLLASIRAERVAENAAAARQLDLAARWADLHPPESIHAAAAFDVPGSEHEEPIAGDGCPLVAEFCVAELGTVLGISTTAAKKLIGHALEIRHRLPRLWAQVHAGVVPAWRARAVAEATIHATPSLTREAAAHVDAQVAAVAGRIGPAQLDRLVAETIKRFQLATPDPAADPEDGYLSVDPRHVKVHDDDVHFAGTIRIEAEVDIADALDVDRAVAHGAELRKALGSTASLDVRRAEALGDLARTQTALDLAAASGDGGGDGGFEARSARTSTTERTDEPVPAPAPTNAAPDGRAASEDPAPPAAPSSVGRVAGEERAGVSRPHLPTDPADAADHPKMPAARQVVLHVHFDAHVVPTADGERTVFGPTGRLEERQRLLLLDQVRSWCGDSRTTITIKPVIDLNATSTASGYDIPDRIREQVILRDGTCVFPWCTRPARRCDVDHVIAFDHDADTDGRPQPGPTATSNLAALCRRHHRLKTHTAWRYEMTANGVFEWTSPHGHRYRRDHTGTTPIDPVGSTEPLDPIGPIDNIEPVAPVDPVAEVDDGHQAHPPGIPRPRRR